MASTSEEKIVAIHQPNFFPWLGYFHKIAACDFFVFHDNVEHSKRYPTRRTMIRKSANDCTPSWLTVPLVKHSDFALIKDLEIAQDLDWRNKHLRLIKNIYWNAPFFRELFPIITQLYESMKGYNHLSDLNIFVINTISSLMEIKKPFIRSSELPIKEQVMDYNLEIVRQMKGTTYFSGIGGKNYQHESAFKENGIVLRYSQFNHFINGLNLGIPISFSILDVLFHLGITGTIKLLKSCPTA